jgi:uncharacterized protein YigE (DUF2233 family)
MFSVSGDTVSVRSLAQFPVDPSQHFDQALQGRPMLLYPGRFPVGFELDASPGRRTAIAQDQQGRVIFITVDESKVSLYRLRDWLAETTEVDFFVAFNLDGGGSTGLALQAGGQSILIDSEWGVATVLAAYPR